MKENYKIRAVLDRKFNIEVKVFDESSLRYYGIKHALEILNKEGFIVLVTCDWSKANQIPNDSSTKELDSLLTDNTTEYTLVNKQKCSSSFAVEQYTDNYNKNVIYIIKTFKKLSVEEQYDAFKRDTAGILKQYPLHQQISMLTTLIKEKQNV